MRYQGVVAGLIIGAAVGWLAGGRAMSAQSPPRSMGLGLRESAIYLRDSYGRCLRLQLRVRVAGTATEQYGDLDIFKMSNEACAKREAAGPGGVKEK